MRKRKSIKQYADEMLERSKEFAPAPKPGAPISSDRAQQYVNESGSHPGVFQQFVNEINKLPVDEAGSDV